MPSSLPEVEDLRLFLKELQLTHPGVRRNGEMRHGLGAWVQWVDLDGPQNHLRLRILLTDQGEWRLSWWGTGGAMDKKLPTQASVENRILELLDAGE